MKNLLKTAWITVNRACNFRCQWCYGTSSGFTSGSDMEFKTARNIVLLLKEAGVKNVVVLGGEPTLWKDLFRFNDLCNSLSIKTTLVTNAYRFRSEQFWLEYLKHSNTHISLSLKAYDEKSSLLITKNRDFDGIKTGIRRVASGALNNQISIVYSTLVENHLLDIVSMAADLGAPAVRISPCTPMSENGKFVAPYTVDYDQMVLEVVSNYKKMVDVTKNKLSFVLKTPLCIWPRDFIKEIIARKQLSTVCQFQQRSGVVFDTNGKVILCNSMFDCSVGKYGVNFTDSKSLLTLLGSEKVDGIYKHINSYPSKECTDCDLFPRCRGGCPIMWTVYNANRVVHSIKKEK